MLASALAVVAVAPVSAQAAPTRISSCTTITASGNYELTSDINESSDQTCVHIQARDVVFDGNGHTIDGDGSGDAQNQTYGINTSRANVTIQNVTATRWYNGIHLEDSNESVIQNATVSDNGYDGIYLGHSKENTLQNTSASGNGGAGIDLAYSNQSTIKNTITSGNDQNGVYLYFSAESIIQNTTASGNAGNGIYLASSRESTIKNATASDNAGNGIYLSSSMNTIKNSTASGNHNAGVYVHYGGNENTIRNTTASDNLNDGILLASNENTVQNITASSNSRYGIYLYFANENTIKNTTASNNSESGIYINGESSTNHIYNNIFNNSQNVGFDDGFTSTNGWNTTRRAGENVIGGPTLGGNYYAKPDSTGFSQTCTDGNGDGICDEPNDFDTGSDDNIDSLPLTTPTDLRTNVSSCRVIDQPGRYELTSDVTNSSKQTCIDIQASNVTFDGNDHTIDGDGSGRYFNPTYGINANGANATIQYVTVTGWYDGIHFDSSNKSTIENSIASDSNDVGIYLFSSGGSTIENTTAFNNDNGIYLGDSEKGTIKNTTISDNNNEGIVLRNSKKSEIKNTTATDNDQNGIHLDSTNRSTIKNTTASGNNVYGIFFEDSKKSAIKNTAASNNDNGIVLLNSKKTVIKNTIASDNDQNGILLLVSDESTVQNATASGNAGDGIYLASSDRGTIKNTTVSDNNEPGVYLRGESSNNSIYNNRFNNSQNVGFYDGFSGTNEWNTTRQPGENIIGGPILGGNYYAKPDGTGFSQTCADGNGDGICENENNFEADSDDNTDFLPVTTASTANIPPTASFMYSPHSPETGHQVSFDASNSSDSDGSIQSYEWDFGDGTTTSGQQVRHAYDSPDEYDVTLTVTDNNSTTNNTTQTVSVSKPAPPPNQDPSASLTYSPHSPETGHQVRFNADKSSDPDGSLKSYNWEFGDGTSIVTSGDHVHHAYESAGTYTVRLTVIDDDGARDTATHTVRVTAPLPANDAPSASFAYSPDSPKTDQSVTFNASDSSDSDGSIRSYDWEFGDNTTANGERATHTYESAGNYIARLTVIDDDGATNTTKQTITISEPPTPPGQSANADHVITIRGDGGHGTYQISVEADLQKSTINDASINPNDHLRRGYVAAGNVIDGGTDSYTYNGSLQTLKAIGNAAVYVDGNHLSRAQIHNYPSNVVEIAGWESKVTYKLSASGATFQKVTANDASINPNDHIFRTTVAQGRVKPGSDAYGFNGRLSTLKQHGDATIYVSGLERNPARTQSHVITIVSDGRFAPYSFSVSNDLTKSNTNYASINPNDGVMGNSAQGSVVKGVDSFVYNGRLSGLSFHGDATVYVDGHEVTN